MKRHIHTVHEGHKDHKCESCNQAFTRASALKKHLLKIHSWNPHKCQFYENLLNYIRFFSEDLYTFKNNSLFCDKYKYQPLIGLLYFLSMSEHLKPKQALFCSKASQGGLPGEGCWTMTRVLDWTPLPQLLSQLDHSDHAESWQSTTAKNNHTWWITWELTHLAKIYKKSAIWLWGTIPWFALKTCFIFWEIYLWTDQS